MKIEFGNICCKIIFEKQDRFSGKKVNLFGDAEPIKKPNKFLFDDQEVSWIIPKETRIRYDFAPINGNEKEEVIAYIIEMGAKQNLKFEPCSFKEEDVAIPIKKIESESDVTKLAHEIIDYSNQEEILQINNRAKIMLEALIYFVIAARPYWEGSLKGCYNILEDNRNRPGLIKAYFDCLPKDHLGYLTYKKLITLRPEQYLQTLAIVQEQIKKYMERGTRKR